MAEVCTHCGGLPIAPGMSQENTEGWCPHCDGSGMASPIQEEPQPKARWYDHWEDGASREHRGMREDDERLARQQEDLYG